MVVAALSGYGLPTLYFLIHFQADGADISEKSSDRRAESRRALRLELEKDSGLTSSSDNRSQRT
jgi:hypothetical protein